MAGPTISISGNNKKRGAVRLPFPCDLRRISEGFAELDLHGARQVAEAELIGVDAGGGGGARSDRRAIDHAPCYN